MRILVAHFTLRICNIFPFTDFISCLPGPAFLVFLEYFKCRLCGNSARTANCFYFGLNLVSCLCYKAREWSVEVRLVFERMLQASVEKHFGHATVRTEAPLLTLSFSAALHLCLYLHLLLLLYLPFLLRLLVLLLLLLLLCILLCLLLCLILPLLSPVLLLLCVLPLCSALPSLAPFLCSQSIAFFSAFASMFLLLDVSVSCMSRVHSSDAWLLVLLSSVRTPVSTCHMHTHTCIQAWHTYTVTLHTQAPKHAPIQSSMQAPIQEQIQAPIHELILEPIQESL